MRNGGRLWTPGFGLCDQHRLWPLVVVFVMACSSGPPPPAALDTRNDTCQNCRMAVSDQHLAAELVAPGEEPKFFDDIGCLRSYLGQQTSLAPGATAYVADHRTEEWVPAAGAVFTRTSSVQTPMASGLIAHRDAASRGQDPSAVGGVSVPATDILGPLARPSTRQ